MIETGKDVRVGLIGYGYAGKTFHAPLVRSVPGLKLTVVGSSKPDIVQADLPGVSVCSDMEEVANHPEIDLLVIASPNESHFPLAAAALRSGKHVVVDKPFTVKLEDARTLVELAEEQGRLLSVFHNRRWDSEVLAAKAMVESGVLGEISHFETHIDRFRPQVRQRWREQTGPGAGLWFDLGPHLIDQALQLFGLPQTVNASFAIQRKGGQTDDWAHVQLNYKSLRVVLHVMLLASGGVPRSVLHGTLGSWVKFGGDVQEKQLVAGMLPGSDGFGVDPDPGIFYEGATAKQTKMPAPAVNQADYYLGIRDALWGRHPNPVPPSQASAVMSILETSFESGARGQVLSLSLTDKERAAFAPSSY
ncbi:oxidoreductase [Granulicella sp. S156]|uniref:oxidoreductase n=1 Tax=Granulicella sp. S156 TaxID=1747224 RepID=UPI00131EB4B5|nr:oxidoreductase [Granulicella sp. S156]